MERIDENIWVVEGACVNFHGFPYPTRSVIIRLETGGLWVWSPIKLSHELLQAVKQLGRVEHLVSPNKIHHLFLSDWKTAFPNAKLWGPRSTIKKRTDLEFEAPLMNSAPDAWAREIAQVRVTGSVLMDEIVFFHKTSDTLIMADFSENFSQTFMQKNWKPWQRKLAQFIGITEGKGHAPLDWRLSFLQRGKTRKARDTILAWQPARVIMAHGEWQRENGTAFLKRSFSWL